MTSGDGDRWARDMMMTLSEITKSLMEVRIHTSPVDCQLSCPPPCPKNTNWQWCTISFETERWSDSLNFLEFDMQDRSTSALFVCV